MRGARCRGRWALMDIQGDDEPDDVAQARYAQALTLCVGTGQNDGCPARQSCEEWFDKLPVKDRPVGVVAGRIWNPRERKRRTS